MPVIQTPYSTWDPKWSETEHEVFRDFGHAAFTGQMLEAALVQVLLAAEFAGRITFDKKADIESELFLSKKTLGQLIAELRRGGMDDELDALLRDALFSAFKPRDLKQATQVTLRSGGCGKRQEESLRRSVSQISTSLTDSRAPV